MAGSLAQTRSWSCSAQCIVLGMDPSTVVLIGPAAVGKSTVGALLAEATGRTFVDLDEVADEYYNEVSQSVDALVDRVTSHGLREGHRWWQPARSHAVVRGVGDHRGSVIALGAGHTHFEDEEYFQPVAEALAGCSVILLLPDADPGVSQKLLRARCASERGEDWGGLEFLDEWVVSQHNQRLANTVIYSESRSAADVALSAAQMLSAVKLATRVGFWRGAVASD